MFIVRVLLLTLCLFVPYSAHVNAQQQLPSASVFLLAEEVINGMLDKNDGSEYQLEPLTRLPDYITLPMGTLDMSPEFIGKMKYNSPVQVRVAIKVNGMPQMNIVTTWRVKKFMDVAVAIKDLPSRTTLSENDIVFERREVTRIDDVVFDIKSIIGLETKRPLTAGSTISKNMLGKPQVIRTGDNVTIISISGSVKVQVAGQALQGGAVGDVIRVRNLNSGKSMIAKVESESTVVITR